ncbi:MAG: hypothetical protein AVDCRST_MAG57-3208, partial [uncultured Blastococcus sp.]
EQESQAVRLPGGQGPGRRPYGRHLRVGAGAVCHRLRLPPSPVRRLLGHRRGPGRRPHRSRQLRRGLRLLRAVDRRRARLDPARPRERCEPAVPGAPRRL